MPVGPTKTKEQKAKVVSTEMHKFKSGDLHSGSKKGPVVKNPKQAVAIALSESGQSKKKSKPQDMPPAIGPSPKAGQGESKPGYDRSSHFKGNPGFAEGKEKHNQSYAGEQKEHWGSKAKGQSPGPMPHASQPSGHPIGACSSPSHGFGHSVVNRSGALRMSGHPGAHRIGSKRR